MLPMGHGFGQDIERQRLEDEHRIFEDIIGIARSKEVDLILVPGDLWDEEAVPFGHVRRIMELCGSLAPIPIAVVPGNHDFLGQDSPYREKVAARHAAIWPDNVHIVRNTEFESFSIPSLPDVSFTAMATGENVRIEERLLETAPPKTSGKINILLFHGSHIDANIASIHGSGKMTAPFSDEELINADFEYAALGHYHAESTIVDDSGNIRGAYAGAPIAREFRDGEHKGVLIFGIDSNGVDQQTFEFIRTDRSRYLTVPVDLTGVRGEEEAIGKILTEIEQAGSTEHDLVRVRLQGAFGRGRYWKPQFDHERLATAVDLNSSGLRADFDLEKAIDTAPSGSVQAEFLMRMKTMYDTLDEASPDERKRRKQIIETAVQIGNDAFSGIVPSLRIDPGFADEEIDSD